VRFAGVTRLVPSFRPALRQAALRGELLVEMAGAARESQCRRGEAEVSRGGPGKAGNHAQAAAVCGRARPQHD